MEEGGREKGGGRRRWRSVREASLITLDVVHSAPTPVRVDKGSI